MTSDTRMPTIYIPHGGGPCFFMDWTMGPPDTWEPMADWLRGLISELPARPQAIVVMSAHWEEPTPTCMTADRPPLLFDYHGFPPHTYELTWPAPGSPVLAERVLQLLDLAGIPGRSNSSRGFDHGVFVPLKVAVPEADIPTVTLSLEAGLDPARHLSIGRALAPLRDEGVLLIGSGMSYHNMGDFMSERALEPSRKFGGWLDNAVAADPEQRDRLLTHWTSAPSARNAHPREEHLLPLMVVAGAAGDDPGTVLFRDEVMGASITGHGFGWPTAE